MQTSDLCQRLLDHVRDRLPQEQDAFLSLSALLMFHPEEVGFFLSEVMVVLMRNHCPLPPQLAGEVSRRLAGPQPLGR
jgi:hypothetical protein